MQQFRYKKLRLRILEKYDEMRKFARVLGISENSLSKKMNGKTQFKQRDVLLWCELLDIPFNEIPEYFFA